MGIFDVNMPLLYGEGDKAFLRLQEDIIKRSDDQTLFAWTSADAPDDTPHGLLAESPASFANVGNIIPYSDWESNAPFSMSNKGLRLELYIERVERDIYASALHCPYPTDQEAFLGIYLRRLPIGYEQYARVRLSKVVRMTKRVSVENSLSKTETVNVRNTFTTNESQNVCLRHYFLIRRKPFTSTSEYKLVSTLARPGLMTATPSTDPRRWQPWVNHPMQDFKIQKRRNRLVGALLVEHKDGARLIIKFGSSNPFEIGFDITSDVSEFETFEELQNTFRPKPAGMDMVVRDHRVRIDATPRVHSSDKYYILDIVVESLHHESDSTADAVDIKPNKTSPVNERPTNAILRAIKKLKLLR